MYSNTKVKKASDQSDTSMEFAGQGKPVSYKQSSRYLENAAHQTMKENYGRGPTVAGRTGKTAGPVEAVAAGKRVDPDRINLGAGPRNAGGTRDAKCPPNPDMINVGAGPRKGNQ
jgi:hypothetical protein